MKWIWKQLKDLYSASDRRILMVALINIISGGICIILLNVQCDKVLRLISDAIFAVYVSSFAYAGYKLLRVLQDYDENEIDRDD